MCFVNNPSQLPKDIGHSAYCDPTAGYKPSSLLWKLWVGECKSWASVGELPWLHLLFLVPRNAPPSLAAALTHEAISQLLKTDLSEFKKLPRQEEEDDDEEEEKAPMTCEFSFLSGDPRAA